MFRQELVGGASGCEPQVVEAVTNAAQNGEKEEKKNQPESVSKYRTGRLHFFPFDDWQN
jgi:hypothetical protein